MSWNSLMIFLLFACGLSAQSSVETPSGLLYTKEQPQLEFSYFKTYDKDPEAKGTLPKDVFSKSSLTFVYAELEMKNLLHQVRDQKVQLTFKFYLQGGELLGELSTTFLIEKEWAYAFYYDSRGWDDPGNWPVGTHYVEVWINNTKFAVKTFVVE